MQLTRLAAISLAAASILAAHGGPARAQRAPDTTALDRGDGITKLGLDIGLVGVDGPPYDGVVWLSLHGQYVTDSGFGFYGHVPLWRSFGDDDDPPPGTFDDPEGDQDATALGNIDLGLLYVIDGPEWSWVFRGGVGAPTSSSELAEGLTRAYGLWPRLTDFALAVSDATYVRLSVSPLYHVDRLFVRADLGFDISIGDDEFDAPELFRANIAGGYDFGLVALSLELANLAFLDDDDVDDEVFLHTLAFAVRFMTERFEPFIAIGAPLDDSARTIADWYIAGGLQFPL